MKKLFSFTWTKLLVALIGVTILCTSAMYVTKKPPSTKETYDKFLAEAGFTNVSSINLSVTNEERNLWEEKGFHYISYSEMDKLMADNGFIIAPANKYIGDIPEEKKKEIAVNYTKLEDDMLSYVARDRYFALSDDPHLLLSKNEISSCWGSSSDYDVKDSKMLVKAGLSEDCSDISITPINDYKAIFVVAHASKFVPGTTNDPGKINIAPLPDPIAVIKHRTGYVVLSSW